MEYSIKHPTYKVTKDIICLKDGFNNKLDEFISVIRGIIDSGAKKYKKTIKVKKKKPSKNKKTSKKKL